MRLYFLFKEFDVAFSIERIFKLVWLILKITIFYKEIVQIHVNPNNFKLNYAIEIEFVLIKSNKQSCIEKMAHRKGKNGVGIFLSVQSSDKISYKVQIRFLF